MYGLSFLHDGLDFNKMLVPKIFSKTDFGLELIKLDMLMLECLSDEDGSIGRVLIIVGFQ